MLNERLRRVRGEKSKYLTADSEKWQNRLGEINRPTRQNQQDRLGKMKKTDSEKLKWSYSEQFDTTRSIFDTTRSIFDTTRSIFDTTRSDLIRLGAIWYDSEHYFTIWYDSVYYCLFWNFYQWKNWYDSVCIIFFLIYSENWYDLVTVFVLDFNLFRPCKDLLKFFLF